MPRRKITDQERQEAQKREFREAVRSIPVYTLARAMNTLTPGVEWRGANKTEMAAQWARRKTPYGHRRLARRSINDVLAAVAEAEKKT